MQYSPKSPQYCRDKAIEYLKRGRDLFNSKIDVFQKEAGYEMFKKGIEKMLEFAKFEKDPNNTQILKDQLKEALQEARLMETVLTRIPEKEEEDDNSQKKGKSILSLITKPRLSKKPPIANRKELTEQDELFIEEKFLVLEKFVDWEEISDTFLKKVLEEVILSPLKYPDIFSSLENWRSTLIYGLPGTGKTYILKSLASKISSTGNITFLWISSCDLISRYIGDGERILKNVFKYAIDRQPSVILIDEIDCIFNDRDTEHETSNRMKTELHIQLMDLQTQNTSVMFLGITNNPVVIGKTLKKFDRAVLIPLPNQLNREHFLRKSCSKLENNLTDVDYRVFAELTEGYTYSDLSMIIREAAFIPFRKLTIAHHFKIVEYRNNTPVYDAADENDPEAIPMRILDIPPQSIKEPKITKDHFANSLKKILSCVTKEYAEKFEKETKELFGGGEKDD